MMVNVGCGPYRAPEPWVNLDYHEGDGVQPDVIVTDPARPLACYPDDTVERVYLGHVLEHVPWPEVGPFLEDIHRALTPGGQVCAVGPDVLRVIQRWRDGIEDWTLVVSVLENPWDRAYDQEGYGIIKRTDQWRYARHWWNCDEERMVWAFTELSPFSEVTPLPITEEALAGWPVVAHTPWQCAVRAVA
jgi:SAM-dependent methyltransferase